MSERYKESHNIEYFVDWVGDENGEDVDSTPSLPAFLARQTPVEEPPI